MSKHDHQPRRNGSRGRERALLVQVTLPGSDRDAALGREHPHHGAERPAEHAIADATAPLRTGLRSGAP